MGDLETIAGSVAVAGDVNALGRFDAVIHNAAIYSGGQRTTPDGPRALFAVNVLAPYILTGLARPPDRLIYLSSGMHLGATGTHSIPGTGIGARGELAMCERGHASAEQIEHAEIDVRRLGQRERQIHGVRGIR